jgi:hypothetical protein
MDTRTVYAGGAGLGLVGSLVTVAGIVRAGSPGTAAVAGGSTVTFALVLGNVSRREDFDRDHALGYRLANLGGALVVVALGLVMLAMGIVTVTAFG